MKDFNRNTFNLNNLPQECIASIISFTTPRDACRLSLVSTTFKSAAEADAVWESFLPSEYQDLIPSSLSFSSKKHLYLYLSENHVLIQDGKKSLSLERASGKKCYMLAPRDLFIVDSDTIIFWRWISIPHFRFGEMAHLIGVSWFEIRGKISISMLSPSTHYKAYLVYELHYPRGFEFFRVMFRVGLVGTEGSKGSAYLDTENGQRGELWEIATGQKPRLSDDELSDDDDDDDDDDEYAKTRQDGCLEIEEIATRQEPILSDDDRYPKNRQDGWLEIEMGEFFNDGSIDDGELEMSAMETEVDDWKCGLIIKGIEIRVVT